MSETPKPTRHTGRLVTFDLDMSQPDPEPCDQRRPRRPEEEPRRWMLVAGGLIALALITGILVGRFLLP